MKIAGQRGSGNAHGQAPTSMPQLGGKIQEAGLAQLGERQTEVKLREIYLKVMCSIHINRIFFSFAEMASAFRFGSFLPFGVDVWFELSSKCHHVAFAVIS